MSMPVITTSCNPVSMSQAVTDLIESIALEETALSHILNAEGEKIQKALAMDVSLEEIMNVNDTVMSMVASINDLEHTLRDKLEDVYKRQAIYCAPVADPGCTAEAAGLSTLAGANPTSIGAAAVRPTPDQNGF